MSGWPTNTKGSTANLNVADQVQHIPTTRAFLRAAQEVGIQRNDDPIGADQSGVFFHQVTQRNARRESASTAFPVRGRSSLIVLTGATTTRIQVRDRRAVRVEYAVGGSTRVASVDREIIVSAGVLNSPGLLSGIGPADELRSVGVRLLSTTYRVSASFHGKLISQIARRCMAQSIRCVAVVGRNELADGRAADLGLQQIRTAGNPEELRRVAREIAGPSDRQA